MKTTKGGKVMNPTDAYRKELRKKELKRNKKERKKVREVGILKKDPETIREQIEKLEKMKADGALDKARKHKKRQLEDTLNLVLKKRKEYEEKMREKGETPVMFSHLGPPRRHTSAEEERVKHPKPEDSVYYHPTLNPTGAPPPGKPPMIKSSIGPRIPLSDSSTSTSAAGSSSVSGSEDASLAILPPPPPPPPPPLPDSTFPFSGDAPALPVSLPLPPPPPLPPQPPVANASTSLPLPPPPPGPPPQAGPPPNKQIPVGAPLPPPPPLPQSAPLTPLGISGSDQERNSSSVPDEPASKDNINQESPMLPLLPPPPGLPRKSSSDHFAETSDNDASSLLDNREVSRLVPPPPPGHRQVSPMPRPAAITPTSQPDMLPPGVSSFPPSAFPLPNPVSVPGLAPQGTPPNVMVPSLMPRPPYGPPPGPPPMMRSPPPPGPPPTIQAGELVPPQPPVQPKPSYVKSAAPTVVKRPLAQHTPELTAMVPASVQVRRESALPKLKPKPSTSTSVAAPCPSAPIASSSSSVPKVQSIDDSYMAFLEDMKSLGALDG